MVIRPLNMLIENRPASGVPDLGALPVSGTGGESKPQFTLISEVSGVNDLFFVFRGAAGEELFKFDYWQFSQRVPPAGGAVN